MEVLDQLSDQTYHQNLGSGNKLKEKSRDLNRNSSRNKNETMFGSGYENCPEFGVLDGVN
jgi:hypothetical protein